MARARTFTRGRGTRRLTEWASFQMSSAYTSLAAATAVIFASFTSGDPETIIRVVGELNVQSDQAAGSERPFGAIGLCVVSDQAFAIGVSAMPTPATDPESDLWLMHCFWHVSVAEAGTVASLSNISQSVDLSSKAARKVNADQTVVLIMENVSGTHGCEFDIGMRLLSKLA